MEKFRRLIVVLLSGAILISAVGCSNNDVNTAPPREESKQEETIPKEDNKNESEKENPSEAQSEPTQSNDTRAKEERDKEARYEDALTNFAGGDTVTAYEEVMTLGDYKDSAVLKDAIFLQNQLGYVTWGAADWFRANRLAFELVPNQNITQAFADKTWLVPNFQSHNYLEYALASGNTGAVTDPATGQKLHDVSWNVPETGFRVAYADEPYDETYAQYEKEVRKAADGVYIFYSLRGPEPHSGSDVVCYIDKNSDFGKRYIKTNEAIKNLTQDPNVPWYVAQNGYGLYYIAQ